MLDYSETHHKFNVVSSDGLLRRLMRCHGRKTSPRPVVVPIPVIVEEPELPPAKPVWFTIEEPHRPLIRTVQDAVCEKYKINRLRLLQRRRLKGVVLPRQIAMYLCRELTTFSFPQIGRKFGGFDHTSVISATRKIERLIEIDPEIAKIVLELREEIDGHTHPSCLPADQTPGVATSNRSPPIPGRAGEAAIGPQNRTGSPATGQNDVAA